MKKLAFIALFFLLSASSAFCAAPFYTPAMSLSDLKTGNLRFLGEKQIHPRQGKMERQQSLPAGQNPKAVVLACADARVPVEVIFDQGIGDLFVFRVPGNTAGRDVQVGIWHAITSLQVPLVVVLGHTECEAVRTVCDGKAENLLPEIAKAVRQVKSETGDKELRPYTFRRLVTIKNVKNSIAEILNKQPGIAELISTSSLIVIGALYDLESGRVEWLEY